MKKNKTLAYKNLKTGLLRVRPQNNGVLFAESFMPFLKKEIGMAENSKILHLFSGKSKIGDTCDIIPMNNPKFNIDITQPLPFEDESYDFVIADPPYDYSVHKNLTDTFKPYSFYEEAYRILRKGGYFVVFHFLNYIQKHGFVKTHLFGVDIGPNFTARFLCIFRK